MVILFLHLVQLTSKLPLNENASNVTLVTIFTFAKNCTIACDLVDEGVIMLTVISVFGIYLYFGKFTGISWRSSDQIN